MFSLRANGTVFTRNGVVYVLWNGQEYSAEAYMADGLPEGMSAARNASILKQIDALMTEIEEREDSLHGDDSEGAFA